MALQEWKPQSSFFWHGALHDHDLLQHLLGTASLLPQ
jgi:hypothetical protein